MKSFSQPGMRPMAFAFFAFLLAGFSVSAQQSPLATVPFRLVDNTILLYCKVNDTDSLVFLFDTGANGMVINSQCLGKKIELSFNSTGLNEGNAGIDTVRISDGNTISFGGITEKDQSFVEIDYQVTQFDGIFGSNIMDRYVIEIDYERLLMRFFDPAAYVYETTGYRKLALKNIDGLYAFRASLTVGRKHYKGWFEMDTGGDNALMLLTPFNLRNHFEQQLPIVGKGTAVGSDGNRVVNPIVVLPEIAINNLRFYCISTDLTFAPEGVSANSDMAGIFGLGFLQRFQTILDLPHHCMYLKPNSRMHTPYYDFLVD